MGRGRGRNLRAPGASEEEDVDADEGDHGLDSAVGASDGTNDGDDELADDHAERTPDEQGAAADSLHTPERDRGRADVDEGRDERDQERVLDGAELLEEGGAEVEDEVDTGPLLAHLQRGSEDGSAQVAAALPDGAAEAGEPGGPVPALGDDGELVLVVGDDLGELVLDELGLDGLAAEAGEGAGGPVEVALLDEVSRGLGEEAQTDAEDDGPQHLEADGDSVGAAVLSVLGGVVNS